jgi:hypothetical protein
LRRALLVAALIAALPLQADTLTELRTLLGTLRGTRPVSASVDVQRSRKSAGRFANNQSAGGATFVVSSNADGLHITIPAPLLLRAAQEARARDTDPTKQAPTRAAIDELAATSIAESLDFAHELLRMLSIGKVTADTRSGFQGRPARQLTLALTEKLPPQATSVFNVKFSDDRLHIWLADDDTPLGAERIRKGSARFLFLKGEMTNRESWTFMRREDRLVVSRYETSFAGSGFGQKGEGRTVQIVTLR